MDEPKIELVRDWLTRASHDLQTARVLTNVDDALLDTAIYHCQQAAEKCVKAWLQSKDDPFPKTHDVEDLVERAAVLNPDFTKLSKAATVLTPYVSAFRYPGGMNESMPTRAEFNTALQYAEDFYGFVVNLLPKDAKP